MQAHQNVTETKILMSDPTALGVFGLAMVTFVVASQKMGWTTGFTYLIPWALFLGSIAQIWAVVCRLQEEQLFWRDRARCVWTVLDCSRDALGNQPGLVR